MKKHHILLIIIWIVLYGLCLNAYGEIVTKYDKFKNMTIITTDQDTLLAKAQIVKRPTLMLKAWCMGPKVKRNRMVVDCSFFSMSDDYKFLYCERTYILVDGKRLQSSVLKRVI